MFLFLCTSYLVASSSAAQSDSEHLFLFEQWEAKFRKNYASGALRESAFNTWKENAIIVADINAQKLSWTATLDTKYADLTSEQFRALMLAKQPITADSFGNVRKNHTSSFIRPLKREVPKASSNDAFDWRKFGAVTPVQDQGYAGTCWSFSTIGNIEGQWFLANNDLTDLSEEFLVDCDGSTDEVNGHADCGIFGGWPYIAYDFVIGAKGVPTEADYPYCAGDSCYPCMKGPVDLCGPPPYPSCDKHLDECVSPFPFAMQGQIDSWTALDTDETAIAATLATLGPLSALFDATNLQFYSSGVWEGYVSNPKLGCSQTSLNHAVLLVGYGTDTETGLDYWTVKNSWGVNFGEDGYFRIKRGDGTCGINAAVTSSLIE